jgi:hypothetical protein
MLIHHCEYDLGHGLIVREKESKRERKEEYNEKDTIIIYMYNHIKKN